MNLILTFEGDDDQWREWARVFRSWSGRFFFGAVVDIYEHVEGHRNDSAAILVLALTPLRFDAGFASQHLFRAVSRAYPVDKKTSTAVGAQGERAGGA